MRRTIFISYRRDDVPGDARGIRERLQRKFGKANVFMDVDNMVPGQIFEDVLSTQLSRCKVLVAVIGPRWMGLLSTHTSRQERDHVSEEIAAALKRKIVVIPVLVGSKGRMPALPHPNELPEGIRALVAHQKHEVAYESFERDADDLVTAIRTVAKGVAWRWIVILCVLLLVAVLFVRAN
jgi:hypothetical protein